MKSQPERMTVTVEKRLRHDFHVLEELEAGIALMGWEVKSVRNREVSLKGGWVKFSGGEAFLEAVHIAPFPQSRERMDPLRERKLLLKKREILQMAQKIDEAGLTVLPYNVYINKKGRVKLTLALVKAKKLFDKRETIKKRETERQLRRYQGSNIKGKS
ncbi:MAG TPA: SsrA-binding protein SmpB [bacterium]|nr:SsrA-binding protein SmpB [bacterium]